MGKHRQVHCNICMRSMRSDNLKRHNKLIHWTKKNTRAMDDEKIRKGNKTSRFNIKDNKFQCNLCEYGSDRNWLIKRHMKLVHWKIKNIAVESKIIQNRILNEMSNDKYGGSKEVLRENLLKDGVEHEEKFNLGAMIYQILGEDNNIEQDSLRPQYKEALDLFIKRKQYIDQQNVILRPWQADLMKYIENPTYREVIWVKGAQGCEGKSWFQEYVETKFGWNRVVNGMDIKTTSSSICHALGKRPLTTTEIFLFNVGKAKTFEDVNYDILEKIKDGKLLASKYDSKELRLRRPNVVVVFSNDSPNVRELAVDRWRIFSIKENNLVDVTIEATNPNRVKHENIKLKVKNKKKTASWEDLLMIK